MAITEASAPGKVILFGEHAVVYGYPAIAIPVSQVRAKATISDKTTPGIEVDLINMKKKYRLADSSSNDPFGMAIRLVKKQGNLQKLPNLSITIDSDIPIASGMGSGAATATALIRALIQHLDLASLNTNAKISHITFHIEHIHHGTPSGVDNTVVAFEQPVFFIKKQPQNHIETFIPGSPLHLLIADTGTASPTKEVVDDVRKEWLNNPDRFDTLFLRCGNITEDAKRAIISGEERWVGDLMNQNHVLLHQMTVSSSLIETLVAHAIIAGSLGAKLSGAGRGGNVVVLVAEKDKAYVREMLTTAGAKHVIASTLTP